MLGKMVPSRRVGVLGVRALCLLAGGWLTLCIGLSSAGAAEPGATCLIVDSDVGLDDFRAVALLGNVDPGVADHRFAAIVVTEGISRAAQGGSAMLAFLRRAGLTVPVIPGATANPERRLQPGAPPERLLQRWRREAETLNGLLPEAVGPSGPPEDVAAALRPHTRGCAAISLLVIGPWTSFLRYGPEILERVERIIVQGRPYPDEAGGEPSGFNCAYDLDACYAAFDLLAGRQQRSGPRFRVTWVDIPTGAEACGWGEPGIDETGRTVRAYAPTQGWVDDLRQAAADARKRATDGERRGLRPQERPPWLAALAVADLIAANLESYERTSLWDDLTALYLLRPDLFGQRGGHVEPCLTAASVRHFLASALAGR